MFSSEHRTCRNRQSASEVNVSNQVCHLIWVLYPMMHWDRDGSPRSSSEKDQLERRLPPSGWKDQVRRRPQPERTGPGIPPPPLQEK